MDRRGFLSRASFGLAAALASAMPRTAASSAALDTQTTSKRDLVVAQAYDLTSLDSHASTLSRDWRVAHNVFDTFIRRHPDGTLHPALASAWKRTASTTWQLALRSDVRWHDGSRFTSVDAKYSLDRTFDATVRGGPHPRGVVDSSDRPDRGAGPGDADHSHAMARSTHAGAPGVVRGRGRPVGLHRPGGLQGLQRRARSAADPSDSCRGAGVINASSTPTPTTETAASTSIGS